jgi:hypothetical protein
MNRTTPAMKLLTYTAAAALLGLGVFTLSLALGLDSTATYAALAGTLFVKGVVRDYSPRRPNWEPSRRLGLARFPSRAHVIRNRRAATSLAA